MTDATTVTPRPNAARPEKSSAWQGESLRKASVAIGCIALFLVFSVLNSTFYQVSNLVDIMLQSSINAVIAVGMTLVIMTRGIDLSVGSVVGLSSMVAADMLSHGAVIGIAAGLGVGLVCGFLNGLLIAKLKLPDFIVTLGTLSIYRGAALIYVDGQPIYGLPKEFRAIFAGRILDVPTPVILAIVVAILAFLLVRFTALGEQIVAIGGNEEAARLSGVRIERVKITVYTLSSLLSSIAGFILIARIGAAEPIGGSGFELQAIGSAVIGGASLFGGVGNPLGSLVGALTLGGLQNGLTLMNVPSFWQYVASGLVVILAVLADQWTRKRG
ncbi:ribose ABC transporter permease [Aureimonas endophytica]|uniref:Ribose ABC transporter permease n=1 Tax=Aureimonas endophytica TaxID=2027858 RepID=A0A916ZMN6_9HYPH|nr:ABC transporter permease [Aureimonas endophytica]GGE05222.1 ribose ABC transporter permease [Aureimonas endophytica]